ncbi:phosphatase PAP2 family protein [Paragemmobacter straminiformis]|uniref:phosphatase PAP2 family protein n=1 Tax=Paragemmobacter straminiformis TaxID=2045119 RepID=UPI001F5130B3|nr:phosphatase PAP2 family protein [Gemmobacter straminiformis]
MNRIEGWNAALFTALNADMASPHALVLLARILAEAAPFAAAAGMVLLWIRRDRLTRLHLLDAALAALVGLSIAQGITHLWYHPRPFELGLGHQFMPHAAEASFPSDHATLLFGLALPLLWAAATRGAATGGAATGGAGFAFAALALATAWSRVYLGVHFPLDMIGGLVVALVSTLLVRALAAPLHARAYPLLLVLYETVLARLHLSARLFPRGR